ncbi:rhodanese-like domain-containing protein [Enhygromyxa salina]|uniref:Thiosulfate sulfurtransferase GlpE n=1 Tax=Enhygromyxa salina TaxID=215803 RepID=A0A2S9YI89_9BACT|nr:rhodanese-like domain-containing protein [Enhygromyxa salina]PRQ04833.1 Thiosulfate sulfurtransferase GlpE [Enhygromyxa salina]
MLALLLIAALLVATIALARQLELLTDLLLLGGASLLAGVVFLGLHPDLEWIATPPADEGSCSVDEIPSVAPVVDRVSIEEAQVLLEQAQVTFVDARPAYHYAAAHIPGAMNLPAEDAEGLLDMQSLPIPPEGAVITYCDGGRCEQSEYLGLLLRERDVCQKVRVLEGGWQAWVAAGGPMVSGDTRFGDAPSSSVAPEAAG